MGNPLLKWTVGFSLHLQSTQVKEKAYTFVSSNETEWLKIVQSWGCKTITRPKRYAQDHSTDLDVLKHAIVELQDRSILRDNHGLVVYLRPTTPYREVGVVKSAIDFMQLHPEYTGLRSIEEMSESAFKTLILENGVIKPIIDESKVYIMDIIRRVENRDKQLKLIDKHLNVETLKVGVTDLPNQMLPPTYRANGYADIARIECILNDDLWGCNCYGFVTPPTIEIDTEDDWSRAEWWAATHGGSQPTDSVPCRRHGHSDTSKKSFFYGGKVPARGKGW